jgi:hypothetical protein
MAQRPSTWIAAFEDFIRYLRISSKEMPSEDDRGAELKLWESQRRVLDFIGHGLDDGVRQFFILKSRQLGCTTISLAITLFWHAMNNKMFGALVTDNEKNRDSNRMILRQYINSFPPGFFGDEFGIAKDNRGYMEFTNGSRLDFLVAGTRQKSIAWAEGSGYTMIHLTELGKYGDSDGVESLMESMAQQNPNRLLIAESTANGMNHWRSMWMGADQDPFTKRAIFLGWWANDMNVIPRKDPRFLQYGGYAASGDEREKIAAVAHLYGWKITPEQLAWIRWRENNIGVSDGIFEQNQPWLAADAFVFTGSSFFQTREITKDVQRIADNPAPVEEGGYGFHAYRYNLGSSFFEMSLAEMGEDEDADDIELRVWEEPVMAGRYAIGFDPAWGRNDHGDRHAIQVFRCYADQMVQVAEYATSEVELKHAAWVLAHLAGAYDNCIVNIDLQGPGRALMMEWDHLKAQMNSELFAPTVKEREWENALANARWYLYNRPDSMGKGYAANFETTSRTKVEIMHQIRGAYVTHELVIRSIPLLSEMLNVVMDGDSIGAPESKDGDAKDDRVFACALAVRVWINWLRGEMLSQGLTYQRVHDDESGDSSLQNRALNQIVERFFLTAQQRAEMTDLTPRNWRSDLGLI